MDAAEIQKFANIQTMKHSNLTTVNGRAREIRATGLSPQSMNPRRRLPRGGCLRRAGGFTMVELLVVVAILVALAALIFGVTKKAITSAKMANKTSMYRQHFAAAALYSADHNGRVCPARDVQGWQVILLPYLMGGDVTVNARTRTSEYFVDPLWKNFDPKKPWVTGVGINFRPGLPETNRQNIYWGDDRDAKAAKKFQLSAITDPSRRIFSGDSRSWYISPWHVDTSRHHNEKKGMFVMFDGAVTFLDAAGAKRAINNPDRPSNN